MRTLLPLSLLALTLAIGRDATAQLPNLHPMTVPGVPSPLTAGQQWSSYVEIRNTHPFTGSASCRSAIYLSTAPLARNDDILLTSWTTAALAPRAGQRVPVTITLPVSLVPRRYWIYVHVDDQDTVRELDETDNIAHTNAPLLGYDVAGVVDLVVTAVAGPATLTPGAITTIPVTIRNRGGIAVPSLSSTGVFLSTNSIVSQSDTLLGALTTPALGAGQSITQNWVGAIPHCELFYRTGSGTWVGAIADVHPSILEHDEDNNTLSRAATCPAAAALGEYLEWRATAQPNQPDTTARLTFDLTQGTSSQLGVTAAHFPRYFYVLLWSGTPAPFAPDVFTDLGLAMLNGPVLAGWAGFLDAGGHALPGFRVPPLNGAGNGFSLFTHHAYFTPTLQFAGFGATPVETVLR